MPVPGTEFGLVQLRVVPITSGLAIGSLIAGIASILVSFLVLCFGLAGSQRRLGRLGVRRLRAAERHGRWWRRRRSAWSRGGRSAAPG